LRKETDGNQSYVKIHGFLDVTVNQA